MDLPKDCLPIDFWMNFFNISRDEINRPIVKLGYPTFVLHQCYCQSKEPNNVFDPFKWF